MRVAILSILLWSWAALSAAVLFWPLLLLWLVTLPFDRRRRLSHAYAAAWANTLHALSPLWGVRIDDLERFDPKRAYVLCANHVSTADILVLFALRRQFRWVAKAELFNVPFVGWAMRMCRYVPIRRGDPASREAMMTLAVEQLRMGNSVAMFPEGTRSHDGALGTFKVGAFQMACEAGVPVLPIVLRGTGAVLPKNAWISRVRGEKAEVVLSVLPPMSPRDHGEDPQRLMHATRDAITAQLARSSP